jgi:hypothetical protein
MSLITKPEGVYETATGAAYIWSLVIWYCTAERATLPKHSSAQQVRKPFIAESIDHAITKILKRFTMSHSFIGRAFRFEYDGFIVIDRFSETHIDYEVTAGPFKGTKGQVPYQYTHVVGGIYAISWQEPDGATVTHIDDFEEGTSLSYFTAADLSLYRMVGTLTEVNN